MEASISVPIGRRIRAPAEVEVSSFSTTSGRAKGDEEGVSARRVVRSAKSSGSKAPR
jgi:hypothetical protein